MTLVEVAMAVLVLSTGVIAAVGTFGPSKDLVGQSELKEAASHRAEREIEEIHSFAYKDVAHPEGTQFASSADSNDPAYYVKTGEGEPSYQWDPGNAGRVDPLVVEAGGAVAPGPTEWADGRFNGTVHRYVTWATDAGCAALAGSGGSCPPSKNFKRVTVSVSIKGLGEKPRPISFSTIVTDPDDGPVDSESGPFTECLDESGNLVTCSKTTPDKIRSLFLHDTAATASERQDITAAHPTHRTVSTTPCTASEPTGCPVPDLMTDAAPPQPDPAVAPPLYAYSNEVLPEVPGGRVLRRDTTCSGAPTTTDDTKGAFWATAPLTADSRLNGKGGVSLFTYALGGGSPAATLCAAFYDVSGDLSTPAATMTEIGRASHDRASWPTAITQVSFSFDFKAGTETVTVPAGHRIGVRLWPASSSAADLALLYDHPTYPSSLQLNEEGG